MQLSWTSPSPFPPSPAFDRRERYRRVRAVTEALAAPLSPEDQLVQSMPDASPTKWHRAHTTWFFEAFVLEPHAPGYRLFDPRWKVLFNSYYEGLGDRHPRPERGLLSRPGAEQVAAYRRHVDVAIDELLAGGAGAPVADLVELGLSHEQQHQELLLTDILHALSRNPLAPSYGEPAPVARDIATAPSIEWIAYPGGLRDIGHDGRGFAYDNEGPRHQTMLAPFRIATRAVTNREYLEFIADGGYRRAELWLSDGWDTASRERWEAPLYWEKVGGAWHQMTLFGRLPLVEAAPVCHVSFYEADAFARWAGKRLPTEAEWEIAASSLAPSGNTLGSGALRPMPAPRGGGELPQQMFGDVWEHTASPYAPYPGYRPPTGAIGEYNGKFMCNQMVLRGGSCLTPDGHVRATYRNFFYPHQRWQMMGLRLADSSA